MKSFPFMANLPDSRACWQRRHPKNGHARKTCVTQKSTGPAAGAMNWGFVPMERVPIWLTIFGIRPRRNHRRRCVSVVVVFVFHHVAQLLVGRADLHSDVFQR